MATDSMIPRRKRRLAGWQPPPDSPVIVATSSTSVDLLTEESMQQDAQSTARQPQVLPCLCVHASCTLVSSPQLATCRTVVHVMLLGTAIIKLGVAYACSVARGIKLYAWVYKFRCTVLLLCWTGHRGHMLKQKCRPCGHTVTQRFQLLMDATRINAHTSPKQPCSLEGLLTHA